MPPADGNAFLAAFVANALRGAFPPLHLLGISGSLEAAIERNVKVVF
jgi:hypothetical protein